MRKLVKNLVTIVFSLCLFISVSAQSAISTSLSTSKSTLEFLHPSLMSDSNREASGTIKPNGAPNEPPIRIEAGEACIVDLIQNYTVTGTLSGSFEINYRIIIHGPCTEPPGTFDEEWIAYGTFSGMVNNKQADGKFTYIAEVRESGNIDGKIVFGQGITGELNIMGNFKDGKLSYQGTIN